MEHTVIQKAVPRGLGDHHPGNTGSDMEPIDHSLHGILREAEGSLNLVADDLNAAGAWASLLVYSLRHTLKDTRERGTQGRLRHLIEAEVFRMCMSMLQRSAAARLEVLETLLATSSAACRISDQGLNPFARLHEFQQYMTLISPAKELGRAGTRNKSGTSARVIWTGKGRLEDLVHLLTKARWTTSKSALFDLFSDTRYQRTHVPWDRSRLPQLAYLWHQLYMKGLTRTLSSKGFFAFAEAHFVDLKGVSLRSHSLKRLSSSITRDPERNQSVIKEVDRMLEMVMA